MPLGFKRANIRFFYLFKNNITGLFYFKRSGDILILWDYFLIYKSSVL